MITRFTLFEASNLPKEDVIKNMKKQDVLKPLFSKIENPTLNKNFVDTLKYYFFNNQQVMDFFKDSYDFKNLRSKKLQDYIEKQWIIDDIKKLISEFNKQVNRTVLNFVNSYKHRSLSRETVEEVKRISSLRPKNPIVLYRGLLFNKYHLEKTYKGEMAYGQKFLNCIKQGTDILNMEFDKVSSWTHSKKIAEGFARFSEQTSTFTATLNWLSRNDRYIDGELGVIISIMAKPKDIVIDFDLLEGEIGFFKHGDENEVIMDKGEYVCRIVKMYNKQGEIDVKTFFDEDVNKYDRYITLDKGIKELVQDIDISEKIRSYYEYNVESLKEVMGKYDDMVKMVDKHMGELKELFKDFNVVEHTTILDGKKQELVKRINDVYKLVKGMEEGNSNVRKHVNDYLPTSTLYVQYFTKKLNLKTNFTIKRYDWDKKKEFNTQMAVEFGYDNFNDFKLRLIEVFTTIERLRYLRRVKEIVTELNSVNGLKI